MKEQPEKGDGILTSKGKENYAKLLEFLSNPENDWPCRQRYSTKILGYKAENQVYRTLSPDHLTEIEDQALANRKTRSARQIGLVREALFKRAIGYKHPAVHILSNRIKTIDGKGIVTEKTEPLIVDITKEYPPDPVAAREFLDRTEGKVTDKQEITHSYEDLSDEELDQQIAALISENRGLVETVMALVGDGGE